MVAPSTTRKARKLGGTTAARQGVAQFGFTLIELLVVIVIIGILAAIALPAFRGLAGSSAVDAAKRQLLDDLGLARLRAMTERTTVYVLFVPPEITQPPYQATNLYNYQLTSYALYTMRTVGEQPGGQRPRFLTEWKHLPETIFIPDFKFDPTLAARNLTNDLLRAFPIAALPYTTRRATFNDIPFRYIAFNAQGQIASGRNEVIPVAKGSIFYDKFGKVDVVPTPAGFYTNNYIQINALTGRARAFKAELK